MARYVTTVNSTKSIEDAFDYLADFSSVREWDPSVVRAERLSPEPGRGARYAVVLKFAGRETELTYETLEYERPHRVVLRAKTSTYTSEDTITFEPAANGCAVTYDADLQLKGVLKIGDPLLGLLFKQLGDKAAAGLRRELGG